MDTRFRLIENFCNKHLNDKRYLRHSDIDLFINIRLTALYNFINLLTEENKQIFLENQTKNNRYNTEIESEKYSILEDRRKVVEENSQKKAFSLKNLTDIKEDSILYFTFPEFEIYFSVKLVVNGHPIEPECLSDLVLNKNFNEQIIIRFKYKDLTPDSYLSITIHSMQLQSEDSNSNVLGYTRINIFDKNYNLVQGKHVYKIFTKSEKEKLNSINNFHNQTNHVRRNSVSNINSHLNSNTNSVNNLNNNINNDEYLKEIDYLVNSFESTNILNGSLSSNFLNNINTVFGSAQSDIMRNYENYLLLYNPNFLLSKEAYDFSINFSEKLQLLLAKSDNCYLELFLQKFNFPVIYEEEKNPVYKEFFKTLQIKDANGSLIKIDNIIRDPEIKKRKQNSKDFISKDNPITEKFSILSRITDDTVAKDLRPGPADTQRINELLNTPDFIKLEDSDTILFWRYRYYLLEKQIGITKILNAVKWGDSKSENEFIQNILNKWTNIEMCDILYMLSYRFCMNTYYCKIHHQKMIEVRNFAVKNLEKFDSNQLNFILLQLVQALRYEDENDSMLKQFLLMRCSTDIELATSLYWFLCVEADDSDIKSSNKANNKEVINPMINFYKNIFYQFENSLSEEIAEKITSQKKFRDKLIRVSNELSKARYEEGKRVRLINLIKNEQSSYEMNKFSPLSLPINPNIKINGTIAESCRVFKSAKYPVKYSFTVTNESQAFINTEDPSIFEIMFKFGDDLRQDQLILQIISFMDRLMKNVHLDFNFTTYKVLATSKSDGFVEFVSNVRTVQDILQRNDDQITPFLKEISNNDYDKTLDNFISSCAGYCVVTYILGIGDRHLENLLIDKNGKLFHIDFGFILGKDPKPFPPPMKLCKQMVEGMGGKNSKGYEEFKKKCVDAYLCLRTNARIIVNMFYLMIHSGINQLSENSEIALNKLHEKFVPNMNPQEASNSLLNKLEESVNAFYPYLMEKFHVWANYFK